MSAPDHQMPKSSVPPLLLPFSMALCAASLAAFVSALAFSDRGTRPAEGTIEIRVTEQVCDPMELTVPAGRRSFRIHNAAESRPLEWEILDGVLVVAERENIAPGFSADVTARLSPGEYQITCGLLSSPRGKLIVTPTDQSVAEQKTPPTRALIAPLSEYKVRLMMAASKLEKTTVALDQAVTAGDLDQARVLYAKARGEWITLEPFAGRFADLKERIDPVAAYLEKGEDDPAFTGFHRLEGALWGKREDGAAAASDLAASAAELNQRIKAATPAPADMAGAAALYARHLADAVVPDGESTQSGQDSAELAQALKVLKSNAEILKPLLAVGHPEIDAQIDREITDLASKIEALDPDYRKVDDATRKEIAAGFAALSATLDQINQAMGLEA